MADHTPRRCTAFADDRMIASGDLPSVALETKRVSEGGEAERVLVFDDGTGRPVEIDLRGTPAEVLARLPSSDSATAMDRPTKPSRRGRPKLGVISKDVTLLPRHWAWLAAQRGSASATLRRLVDEARRDNEARDQVRQAQDRAYRFMSAMVGNEPGYEEAIRALYQGDGARFEAESEPWPADLRAHSRVLAAGAFPGPADLGADG